MMLFNFRRNGIIVAATMTLHFWVGTAHAIEKTNFDKATVVDWLPQLSALVNAKINLHDYQQCLYIKKTHANAYCERYARNTVADLKQAALWLQADAPMHARISHIVNTNEMGSLNLNSQTAIQTIVQKLEDKLPSKAKAIRNALEEQCEAAKYDDVFVSEHDQQFRYLTPDNSSV